MRISAFVLKPIITEKSMWLSENGKYVFHVTEDASAGTVKRELKKLYNVDVTSVHVIILPGKKRRMGKSGRFKKTAKRKKVIVTIKEGLKIDVAPHEKAQK